MIIFFLLTLYKVLLKARKRGRKDTPAILCTTLSMKLLRSPLLRCLQLDNVSVKLSPPWKQFYSKQAWSRMICLRDPLVDSCVCCWKWSGSKRPQRCLMFFIYPSAKNLGEESLLWCICIFNNTHETSSQFGTSSVLPWWTHAVSLLVCVKRMGRKGKKWQLQEINRTRDRGRREEEDKQKGGSALVGRHRTLSKMREKWQDREGKDKKG